MADVQLSITISDGHVSRVLDAVTEHAGQLVKVEIQHGCSPARTFVYDPKAAGESVADFGRRFLRGLVHTFVRCHELSEDHARFVAEQQTVVQPSENVPADIVT